MFRLTERPDMTLDVYRGRKTTTTQQQQQSVSNADREIPTLGSTDNAGIEVCLVSGIIRLPSGWDFSV